MKNLFKRVVAALFVLTAVLSCSRLEVTLPKGPQGEQGAQGMTGESGKSSYEVWVSAVKDGSVTDWDKSKTGIHDYFLYLKGEQGDKGEKGDKGEPGQSAYATWKELISGGEVDNPQSPGVKWNPENDSENDFYKFLTGPRGDDGLIPYIGADGNWYIGQESTGIPATGPRGDDGMSSYEVWVKYIEDGGDEDWPEDKVEVQDYFKYISGKDGRDGKDGSTPSIGPDGNWFIGSVNTGIPARGDKGEKGDKGDRGDKGEKGDGGEKGLSAYELWKTEVLSEEGIVNPGNGVYDLEEYPLWPSDAVSEADFYLYLHGVKGDRGLSAYEVWKEYISSGEVDNPQDPETKWNPADNTERDFYVFLTGPKGDDGLIPYIGENGNWFIGDEDTEVPASGPQGLPGLQGKDGTTPHVGANGNWFIGEEDTGVPARGADGNNGQDGKNGNNGNDGKSAYELWKSEVLSDSGLVNPGNGVYDVSEHALWPSDAVSISDFWLYLKGKDGSDGQDGKDGVDGSSVALSAVLEYSEEVDPQKYNLAPVRALMKVSGSKNAAPDTTYEYVNPYSGGAAFIVTGPGPVIIPDCEVVFKNSKGTTYTKTSDGNGFVYLDREELPEYEKGDPSASPSRPLSFKYGDNIITDPSKIGQTCQVPYQVKLSIVMNNAELGAEKVTVTSSLSRMVEGVEETSCGGVDFPFWDESSGRGYKYYRSSSAIDAYYAAIGSAPSFADGVTNSPDDLTTGNNASILCSQKSRSSVSTSAKSSDYLYGEFGTGPAPTKIEVSSQVYSISSVNGKLSIYKPLPDYGLKVQTSRRAHVPEIRRVGDLDYTGVSGRVSYPKAGTAPEDVDDPANRVPMRFTNYKVILGQTEFAGYFDLSTFGQCYVEGKGKLSGDTYEFVRFDSLSDYIEASGKKTLEGYVNVVGNRGGTKIDNHVAISNNGWDIKDLYNGFTVIFGGYSSSHNSAGKMKYGDVHYAGVSAEFRYSEGSYTCFLSGSYISSEDIQVIYDGFTK